MNKKTLIVITIALFFFKYSFAQNPFPKQLVGYWINAEYERALKDSQSEKIESLISPQFLYFDSLGNCTVRTRIEHKLIIGKPISKRRFRNAFQFSYKLNKNNFTINEIEDNDSLLYINFSDILIGMVFKKYKRN